MPPSPKQMISKVVLLESTCSEIHTMNLLMDVMIILQNSINEQKYLIDSFVAWVFVQVSCGDVF